MDFEILSRRIEALRAELETVREHNRRYFSHRSHSPAQKAIHESLELRVAEIRGELSQLLQAKKT